MFSGSKEKTSTSLDPHSTRTSRMEISLICLQHSSQQLTPNAASTVLEESSRILGIVWVLVGYGLLSNTGASAQQPSRVSLAIGNGTAAYTL